MKNLGRSLHADWRRWLALVAFAVLTSSCASPTGVAAPSSQSGPSQATSEPARAPIKIGVLTPLTGSAAPSGAWNKLGSVIAAEIINNAHPELNLPLAATLGLPNLGGAKIELVYGDSQGQPATGASEAERLITVEHVVAITGIGLSGVAAAVQPVAERLNVPIVEGTASSPTLTRGDFKWFFRTATNDREYSRGIFEFLQDLAKQKINVQRVALLHEDTLFGKDSAAAQTEFAQAGGFQIVADIQYHQGSNDFTPEIQRLIQVKPDVLLPSSYAPDAILLLRTMQQLNYVPPILLAQDSGFVDANFTKTLGTDANGVMSRASWTPDINKPDIPKVLELARKMTGSTNIEDDFTSNVAQQMTTVLAIADAINRAGTTESAALRKALLATNIPGDKLIMPWPGIQFDPATQQNVFAKTAMIQRQDNRWWTVWPFDQAGKKLLYPFPAWSGR